MNIHPSDFEECLDTARALLSDGEEGSSLWDANDLVNRALALDPEAGDGWLLKCQILSALGDDVAALAAVSMAIRVEPDRAEVHYWHAAVLADLERYDDSLAAIELAFRAIGPGDEWLIEDLFYDKAAALDALGCADAALATYEDGLRRCPDSVILRSGLEPLRRQRARQRFTVIRGGLG